MPIAFRNFRVTGVSKTSSNIALMNSWNTANNEFPQVNDLMVVAIAADNLSSTTPTITSLNFNGINTGEVGPWTIISGPGSPIAAAAGGSVSLMAYAIVTKSFTDAPSVSAILSGSITAKSNTLFALSGVNLSVLPTAASASAASSGTYTIASPPSGLNRLVSISGELEASGYPGSTPLTFFLSTTGAALASNVAVSYGLISSSYTVNWPDGGYIALDLTPTDYTPPTIIERWGSVNI